VDETKKYRKLGLPKEFIVIENCDEWLYCIDSRNGEVVSWNQGGISREYPDFDTYVLDRFEEAAENI